MRPLGGHKRLYPPKVDFTGHSPSRKRRELSSGAERWRKCTSSFKSVHKKVTYLSIETSITMILHSRSQQEVRMSAEAPKAAVEDLIAKVVGGKALEAFDRYYADDVT